MEGNELLEAVRAGELERVKVLVEQDTGVDKDNALRWAARGGTAGGGEVSKGAGGRLWRQGLVVRFLVEECGVDVNASNTNDYTALMWAVRSGEVEVVRYLAGQSGINVDAKDNYGYTALMKACKGGRVAIVQCLVEAGSDVDESDGLGHTPLMIASGCGHREIVWHLVERCHAVLNSRNNRGETAVRLASDCGYRDVERYLTSHSPLSYVSAAPTSTTDSDIDESATTSISPSEIDPVDFSTSSSMGTDYRRATWLKADATLILAIPHSDHSVLEEKVRLWQALRHPNVMDIYGICRAVPQLQVLVCEHSSKGPLIGFVKSSSVAMPLVWKYLHEAAVGLAYFHGRGLAHGDLRCSNIFIGNDGTAKLFNGNLGGVLEKSSSVSTGPIGSIRWQSPEILRGEQPSFMSDVYSLGMCILEVVTRRIPWEDCGSDICVRDLKMRWTPESAGDENLGPKCPLGNEKDLIWRICCQNPEKRVSLASLVGELRNLAMEDGSTAEPGFDDFGDDSIRKIWMAIQTDVAHCDDDFFHEAFDEIKKVREHLLVSPFRTALLKQFGVLVRGIRAMTIGSREHSVVLKLSVPSDISSSRVAFRQLLRSIWKALGETTELARGRKERWKHYGWLQTEIIISEVSDSYVLLGEVKTRGERSKLLASLRAEIDQSFKYTPGELGLLKKAFDDISSRVEIDALSKLTPQWFIPWYELLVGEWDYLREVEFGRVHRAKWHDADVVIKRAVLADTPDSDSTLSVKDSLLDTPSASQDQRNAIQQSEELAAFRHEVDIWFGLNHPHVIRLFGACHVGTPFFVCEYAPNGTMVSYLRKHPDEIWSKLLDVALGVQYLHARGIVHGDLKGNNIVIAGDLKAKVADFSTSFVARDDARSLISGAWHWLAPECFDGTQPPTFASDVYSLGMCVVEALRVVEAVKARQESRSSFPWRDLDRNSVKYYATKGSLPTRPSICEDCQWELVERMCALDSKKRIPIAEVVDELTRLASSRHNDSIAISRTESLELGSIPQLAATAQRRLAKLQQDSKQEELTSVLLLYVSLWNRLEQIHGQSSYRDNDDLPAEFFSLVGEVDAATSELQDSNRSLFALAVLALRCYASERCLNKLGGKETDLMWAARNGQIQVVQSLIDGGADVNAQDDEGQTALMAAAEYDQIDIVRYLIKHGASLTATDNIGDTVLMITAGKGLVRVCQHLADHPGTDVNATNQFGYTALMTAAVNGHAQVVQYLAGHQGVDVNAADEYGYTPLMMATLSGATDVVRCLAEEYGADVNAKAREGDTALILAAVVGHIEVFRYFTERRGLDVNVKNNNGETALMRAAENGNIAVVRSITGYGVDVNVENTRGYTALMNAAKNGHVEIVHAGKPLFAWLLAMAIKKFGVCSRHFFRFTTDCTLVKFNLPKRY
ncbi:hypothetical protein ON010_g14032 [Phytophthora cinnamomi]|nr:hypothetical protein ON010_g14032 [Phytophthora cinnamomi]